MQTTQSSNTVGVPGSAAIISGATAAPATLTFNTANRYNISAGPFGSSGTIHAPGGVITDADKVTERDLNSDVFNTPVETLVNAWLARYKTDWVDLDVVMEDPFFALVYKRLRSLGELETHYLTDRSRYVCRHPE